MLPNYLVLALLLVLAAVVAKAEELPRYKHSQMNVYPVSAIAKGGITVDGNLAEWKPEAFVTMYADPDLEEQFSCRVAFAYDANGLYLAARFKDTSPLQNIIDPTVDPFAVGRAMRCRSA